MWRTRSSGIAAMTAAAALGLVACAGGSDADSTPEETLESMTPIVLSYNNPQPAGGHYENVADAYLGYIEEKTDGKVTFDRYFAGSLLPVAEAYSGVGSGLADISFATTIGFNTEFPTIDWLSGALSQNKQAYPLGDLVNYSATNELILSDPAIQEEFAALNVKPIFMASSQPGDMLCREPVETLADAAGLMTRSPSAHITAEVEALGMTPVSMAFPELYEGLQRGVLDCVYTTAGAATFKSFGMTEVAKYYSALQGWTPTAASGYVMNLDVWNSLPTEVQRIFDEAAVEAMVAQARGILDQIAEFADTADADGVVFTDTSELSRTLQSHQDAVYSELVGSAPPSVEDPQDVLDTFNDMRATWLTKLTGVAGEPGPVATDSETVKERYSSAPDAVDWDEYTSLLLASPGFAGAE